MVNSLSTMGTDSSSDDLIRQAKESFTSPTSDREMPPERPAEDNERAPEPQTVADRMYDKLEADRVDKTPSEPEPFRTYRPKQSVTDAPRSSSGGGRVWRIIGIAILVPIAALWALLLVGLALDPEDAGSVIGGAVILTGIPIGIGILALKRAARS